MNANTKHHITTNLAKCSEDQLDTMIDILCALRDNGLPDEFKPDDYVFITVDHDKNSVAITNLTGKVAVLSDEATRLDTIYRAPDGTVGTFHQLVDQYWAYDDDRVRPWLQQMAIHLDFGFKIPEHGWLQSHLSKMANDTKSITKKVG